MAGERLVNTEDNMSAVESIPYPGCYILKEIEVSQEAVLSRLNQLRNLVSPRQKKVIDEIIEYKPDLDEPLTPVR